MEVGTMTGLFDAVRKSKSRMLVLAAGLGTSAAIWGPEFFAPGQPAKAANTASSTDKAADGASKALPAGFSQFRSDQAGIELAYPSTWTKLTPKDPQILLLIAQGTQDSVLVRASELQEAVGPQQMAAAR